MTRTAPIDLDPAQPRVIAQTTDHHGVEWRLIWVPPHMDDEGDPVQGKLVRERKTVDTLGADAWIGSPDTVVMEWARVHDRPDAGLYALFMQLLDAEQEWRARAEAATGIVYDGIVASSSSYVELIDAAKEVVRIVEEDETEGDMLDETTRRLAKAVAAYEAYAVKAEEPDPRHPHIVGGEFQSDKYPTCPRGKVPLSVRDESAQDLLWLYAQRRRPVDAQFSDDLEYALGAVGYQPIGDRPYFTNPPDAVDVMSRLRMIRQAIEGIAVEMTVPRYRDLLKLYANELGADIALLEQERPKGLWVVTRSASNSYLGPHPRGWVRTHEEAAHFVTQAQAETAAAEVREDNTGVTVRRL